MKARDAIKAGKEKLDKAKNQGDYEDALDWFEESINFHPSARAWPFKAYSFYFLERYEEAITSINTGLQFSPIEKQVKRTLLLNKACFLSMLKKNSA